MAILGFEENRQPMQLDLFTVSHCDSCTYLGASADGNDCTSLTPHVKEDKTLKLIFFSSTSYDAIFGVS